jgi:tetratricopeptide (TPR) repeat protein
VPLVRGFAEQNRRGDRGATDIAAITLGALEENATLRVVEGQLLFPVVYMQTVEGMRRDVRVEAPRSVVHPRSAGGGPIYFSSDEGIPPAVKLAPWGLTFRRLREGERVEWDPAWDDFTLRTRPPRFMEPMEREVVFGFHLRYARNLALAGQDAQAARELRRAEAYAERAAEGWLHMTRAWRDAGMPDHAVRCARRAVEKSPNDWRAQLFAGLALEEADELPAAEPYFREAARLEPDNGVADLYLADLLLRLRRADEAVEPARRGIQRNPGHPLAAPIREALGERLRR